MKAYDEALNYDPNLAEAHLGKGIVYELAFGKLDEAEAEYRKAIQLKPTMAEAHNNLGQLLARTGRLEEAVKEFDLAASIMLYREPWVARCNKGQALWRMGKKDEGVAELKACLNFQPRYCQGWRELGRIQLTDGQGKEAVALLRAVREELRQVGGRPAAPGRGPAPDRTGGPGEGLVPEVRRARRRDPDRRRLQEERRAAAVTTGAPDPAADRPRRRGARLRTLPPAGAGAARPLARRRGPGDAARPGGDRGHRVGRARPDAAARVPGRLPPQLRRRRRARPRRRRAPLPGGGRRSRSRRRRPAGARRRPVDRRCPHRDVAGCSRSSR